MAQDKAYRQCYGMRENDMDEAKEKQRRECSKCVNSVAAIIERAQERVCDEICKWPERYGRDGYEDMLEEKCSTCPMAML